MDEGDYGQDMEARFRSMALEKHFQRVKDERADMTYFYCIDCGDEIPEKRRENEPGCTRCVPCQTKFERGC
ncbi:MAG: TraR/DksA C4-type zinc finger protein [Pseudomonadota bacterium]